MSEWTYIDYSKIPPHTLQSLNDYALKGWQPGGFLIACLANDLMGAFGMADANNMAALRHITGYIYNCMPSTCHGNSDRVAEWINAGGAEGLWGQGAWTPYRAA